MQRVNKFLGLGALVGVLAVGAPAALSAQDTSAVARDTADSTLTADSAKAQGYEAGRAVDEGQESGDVGRPKSGVTPNRAGLPGDTTRPHPDAENLKTDVKRVETDSGAVETAPNPPGVQSPPAGDSANLRGVTPSGEGEDTSAADTAGADSAAADSAAADTSDTSSTSTGTTGGSTTLSAPQSR